MKKVCVMLVAGLFVVGMLASQASAIPPFLKGFNEQYKENAKVVEAAGAAKCNVCHDANSKSKKDKNEYGKALGKYLKKADFEKVNEDAAGQAKLFKETFEKAEADKAGDGKSYGEKLKAGTLPGA